MMKHVICSMSPLVWYPSMQWLNLLIKHASAQFCRVPVEWRAGFCDGRSSWLFAVMRSGCSIHGRLTVTRFEPPITPNFPYFTVLLCKGVHFNDFPRLPIEFTLRIRCRYHCSWRTAPCFLSGQKSLRHKAAVALRSCLLMLYKTSCLHVLPFNSPRQAVLSSNRPLLFASLLACERLRLGYPPIQTMHIHTTHLSCLFFSRYPTPAKCFDFHRKHFFRVVFRLSTVE